MPLNLRIPGKGLKVFQGSSIKSNQTTLECPAYLLGPAEAKPAGCHRVEATTTRRGATQKSAPNLFFVRALLSTNPAM